MPIIPELHESNDSEPPRGCKRQQFKYGSMVCSEPMDREKVLAEVRSRIEALPGVIAIQFLDRMFHDDLMSLENEAEANGACGGLMPFTNRGVWESFKREVQFIIVVEHDSIILGGSSDLVYISDQKGQIVGEWLNPQRMDELKDRKDVCFLSSDFVLYPEVEVEGEPYFVLPEIDFPYLKDVQGVMNITSGSISTLADDYIRSKLGFGQTRHWTHLVGFDIRKD